MKVIKLFEGDILVRELEAKTTTTSGLYTPNAQKQYPFRVGVVTLVNDKCTKVQVGDVITFDMYAGTTIHQEGTEMLIVAEKVIFCVIDNDGEFVEKTKKQG